MSARRVVIVGGGAAGLSAAIAAADCGAAVTVLERLPRVGKKILLTGNGRCNLGHQGFEPERFHGSLHQALPLMENFDTAAFFRQLGVLTRTDAEGRMYPASGTAASVLDALRFAAASKGAELRCGCMVTGLRRQGRTWQVRFRSDETNQDAQLPADAVILAAGGSAAPSCGTDGNLLELYRSLGLTVVPPRPSLCPVPTDKRRVQPMKGLRVRAAASLLRDGRPVKTETGEVQFTEGALSGICVFNLSREAEPGKTALSLNLCPDMSPAEVVSYLQQMRTLRGRMPAAELLTGLLPKRIGECLLRETLGSPNTPAADLLSGDALPALASVLQDWRFPVAGRATFDKAQVTAGGISGRCLTPDLEVQGLPGLYAAGEAADLDADCGGYNLTWAWCSGAVTGRHAAK